MLRARLGALGEAPVGVLLRGAAPVLALSVDQLVAWGVLYYAYTVLSRPIAADLGVAPLYVAGAFSVCLLTAGWAGQRVGAALDERGTRGTLRLGALLAPPAFAGLALVRGEVSLVVAFVLLGAVQSLSLYEPAFRTLVDWYPRPRARARAMLALTCVAGLASTLFLPLTGALVGQHGWRLTVVLLAVGLALVLLPVRYGLPLSERRRAPPSPSPRAPSSRSSRLLEAGVSIQSFAATGVSVYLLWHLVERGTPPATAAGIAGLAGAAQVPGRVAAVPLRRAIGGAVFLPLLLVVQASSLAGVVLGPSGVATASALVFGGASGMMTLERVTVLVEWYGRRSFGARQGQLSFATSIARAVAPLVVELGHHVASYRLVFSALAVALAVGAWLCSAAARARAAEGGSAS